MIKKRFISSLVLLVICLPLLTLAQTPPAGYVRITNVKGQAGDFFCRSATEGVGYARWDTKGEHPFCKPNSCGQSERLCPAADKPLCCPSSWQCGVETKDVNPSWNIMGSAKVTSMATCLPPAPPLLPNGTPIKANDYIACGPTSGDNKMAYCAKSTQECVEMWMGWAKFKHCQPKNAQACPAGNSFIQGTGDYANEKRCCPKGMTGSLHPKGIPFCAQQVQSASASVSAQCNSLDFYNFLSLFYPDGSMSALAGGISSSCSSFAAGAGALAGPDDDRGSSSNNNGGANDGGSGTVTAANPIRPDFSLSLPRGGEVWPIGSTEEIGWSDPNYNPTSGLEYAIYASTRDGSWYGQIGHTSAPSLNWQVGQVTVNGLTRLLSPGNYWIQVIKQDGQTLPNGQARTQAFSANSVELMGGAVPSPILNLTVTPSVATVGANPVVSWAASYASTCTASGAWTGNKNPHFGSYTPLNLTNNTYVYTLTCVNQYGQSVQKSATLVMNPRTSWLKENNWLANVGEVLGRLLHLSP